MLASSPIADRPPADASANDRSAVGLDLDARLAAHQRAAALSRFAAHLDGPLAVAVLIAGGAALVLRLNGRDIDPALWTLLAGAALAGCVAGLRTRGEVPGRREVAATLDGALRSGGLLMTLADLPPQSRPAEWAAKLEPRRDRWRDARPGLPLVQGFKTLAAPILFAALACVVPVAEAERTGPVDRSAAGDRLTDELADTLAALADAGAADPAALARVEDDLRRLTEQIGENGPTGSQLEAADALRDRMLGALTATDGASADRFAQTLAGGADLLAGSGLLESDTVRSVASAAGIDDPAALAGALEMMRENPEAVQRLLGGLTDEQRAALLDAGRSLAAGGDPQELLDSLSPELVEAVTAGRPPADAAPPPPGASPMPPRPVGSPAASFALPSGLPSPGPLADGPGALAARAFAPGLSAAASVAGELWSGRSALAPPALAAAEATKPVVERSAPPPAGVAAGRPVPPRLRGVVRRYFSGQTPPSPAPPAPTVD